MLHKHPVHKTPIVLKGDSCLITGRMHTKPMYAFLQRSQIGNMDQYGRGIWIRKSDLPKILAAIKADPSAIECGRDPWNWGCNGSNIHNTVYVVDFLEVFGIYDRYSQNDHDKILEAVGLKDEG